MKLISLVRSSADARLVVLAIVAVAAAAALRASQQYPTRLFDLYPLYYGGLAWVETGNAYLLDTVVPATDRGFQLFEIGNLYPLPAVFITLPLTLLHPQSAGTIWVAFLVAGLIAALRLYGGSYWFLLYVPLIEAVRIEQYTAFIVIAQIVALWALRERRVWILAVCCALILTKPNHGLAFVIAVALLSGSWRRIGVVASLPWLASLALDPSWPAHWVAAVAGHQVAPHQRILWPIALLGSPLLLVGDVIGAAVVLQFFALPFPGVYAASSLLLPLLRTARLRWLVATSFLWPFPAVVVGTAWATALTLVLPMVIASLHLHRAAIWRLRERFAS